MRSFVLKLSCPDRPGIVNAVTGAVLEIEGNILESSQYGDVDSQTFALRMVIETDTDSDRVADVIGSIGPAVEGTLSVRPLDSLPRMLIMVSRFEHCLLDLLFRQRNGELPVAIPLIISNHEDCADLAARYQIPFQHVPVTPDTKADAERVLLQRIEELSVDFVVLARYMQILSADVCRQLTGRAINIHHSFLPGFKGSRPYHQAHARGVKLIGATAHYVTEELDEGPIIEQDTARVTHADSAEDMERIGRDVERVVLARAVRYHAEDRVVLIGSKTVVFS